MSALAKNNGLAIKWIAIIVLTIIPLLIPEGGVYTYQVKLFFAITVCGLAIAALETVPMLFVSILMPSFYVLLKVAGADVVMSPWVGTTFLMIPGALFMAATLEDSGLLKRIAYFLMCKTKGSYLALLFGIFLTGVVLNILTSGRAYFIMAPLVMGLCMSLDGMQKNLGAGLAMAVMVGSCTSHAFTYQATGWAVLYRMGGEYVAGITPLSIMMHNWPLLFVAALIVFVMSRMFKVDDAPSDVSYFEEELKALGKVTKREKVNALMLALLLVYIFTVDLHHLDVNLGFAILPFIVFLPGLEGADGGTIKKVNFPIIFFVAACMSIGTVAASLGIGQAIASGFEAILAGNTSPFAIMALIFGVVFLLNFFMTPMAIFALITAPVLMMVASMGLPTIPFTYAINAVTEAIILPYEYVPYLIVFSFGMISMKDFIKANIVRSLLFFGGFLVVLVPYWMLIGLL